MNRKIFLIAIPILVVAMILGAQQLRQNADNEVVRRPDVAIETETGQYEAPKPPSLAETLGLDEEDLVDVGGVKRPERDVAKQESVDLLAEREKYLKSRKSAGETREVSTDTSEQIALLHNELKDKKNRSMAVRSALVSDEVFDREAYLADPDSYLLKVRPARSTQALKPGPGIVPIEPVGGLYREIVQGESAILEVKAEPGMPVTFHAQLGEFDNQLKTISVASSEDGVAKVAYKAVSGVRGNITLTAASPVHSGRLNYLVRVATKN